MDGEYRVKAKILLIADMAVMAVTSVLISRNVFSFIGLQAWNKVWKTMPAYIPTMLYWQVIDSGTPA